MRLVEPSAEIYLDQCLPLQKVEQIAKVCTGKELLCRGEERDHSFDFCLKLFSLGHFSPFEHVRLDIPFVKYEELICDAFRSSPIPYGFQQRVKTPVVNGECRVYINGRDYLAIGGDIYDFNRYRFAPDYLTVCFTIDIGISREMIRHRSMSFMERSTRIVDLSDLPVVIPYPFDWAYDTSSVAFSEWENYCQRSEANYKQMRSLTKIRQESRLILPLSTATKLYVTGLFGQWKDLLRLRLGFGANPQIRYVCQKLVESFERDERLTRIFEEFCE